MDLRKKAQKRIIKWKGKLLKGWEISELTGVDETVISRIFRGKGLVSDRNLKRILEAEEPKQ